MGVDRSCVPRSSSLLNSLLAEQERRRRHVLSRTTIVPELSPDQRADACITWIEQYCKLLSDTGSGVIPFTLFDYQKDFIRAFWTHREIICLKARQLGMTETVAAIAVYCAITFSGWTIILLSKDQDAANEVLSKCRISYDYLPDTIKVPVINSTITSSLRLTNRSRIIPKPTSPGAGRSFNAQVLVMDEVAHMMWADQVYAAASPAARSAGNRIVAVSTAKGVGNLFHRQWTLAQAGEGMFPIFLPWYSRPSRDDAWFKAATRGYEPWQIAQELPTTAEEAFVLSGRPRFNIDALQDINATTRSPVHTEMDGQLRVWDKPAERGRYVMGVDTAEGLLKGDYCSATVMDYYSGLDVAELHGHFEPALFADLLNKLGHAYNQAYMMVEVNNHGAAVLLALTTIHAYPHLHMHQDVFGDQTSRPGWRTTSASKPVIIDALATTIHDRVPYRNALFIAEAMTYVIDERGATNAAGDAHDDRVISYALALMARQWAQPERAVVSVAENLGLDSFTSDDRYGLRDLEGLGY